MDKRDYLVFSEGKIGPMRLKNRIVRSATVDAYRKKDTDKCGDQTIGTHAKLAQGGVGLIITGDISAALMELVQRFAAVIAEVKTAGFYGFELHAVHGHALLSYFLSPYTNRRTDEYGGSAGNRTRIIREIIDGAREHVGNFPIPAKINCNDNVKGGIDIDSFPEFAGAIVDCGVDAIEISGGSHHCLVKSEAELGFPPVPVPEAHTRIDSVAKQSYFHALAEAINLDTPVILVGGNRDIERMESAVKSGSIDFFALCRPLINDPDLLNRWHRNSDRLATSSHTAGT